MTRLIDADKLKKAFENLASDDYNEPIWYQQTVFETIDNAPTVVPEEMKPLIDKTIEILPQLTDAIVENLPRILDDIDICQECEYRKTSFKEADDDKRRSD